MLILWIQALLNAIRSYKFVECALIKLADILSTSARYEKMFENKICVQVALKDLYLEVLLFLQKIQTTVCKKCMSNTVNSMILPNHSSYLRSLKTARWELLSIHRRTVPRQYTAAFSGNWAGVMMIYLGITIPSLKEINPKWRRRSDSGEICLWEIAVPERRLKEHRPYS